jgi:TM2 domain-containing membrane protein YozV
MSSQYCSKCGEENALGAKYCSVCGSKFEIQQSAPPVSPPPAQNYTQEPPRQQSYAPPQQTQYDRPPKDRIVAGILALLLGGFGIHKFYLGNIGAGLLYLCFSWTFIPEIIGFIEGIIYLTESDEEFQRNHAYPPMNQDF